jgi:hypothetical protein
LIAPISAQASSQHLHRKSQYEKHRGCGLYWLKLEAKGDQSLAGSQRIAAIRPFLKIRRDLSALTKTRR